jgi:NADH:ubiquinone oxidoreductase subunit 5 (subunit L)/multisubunit Na+/H+ antiporter MnhA subunit
VLAVLSIVGGFIQVPTLWDLVNTWIDPVAESIDEASGALALVSTLVALAAALLGVWLAAALYRRPSETPARLRRRWPRPTAALEHKLYFDELYDAAFYEPAGETAVFLRDNVEESFLLASLGELGDATRRGSGRVAGLQTGAVRLYVLAVAVGLAALAIAFLIAS